MDAGNRSPGMPTSCLSDEQQYLCCVVAKRHGPKPRSRFPHGSGPSKGLLLLTRRLHQLRPGRASPRAASYGGCECNGDISTVNGEGPRRKAVYSGAVLGDSCDCQQHGRGPRWEWRAGDGRECPRVSINSVGGDGFGLRICRIQKIISCGSKSQTCSQSSNRRSRGIGGAVYRR